MILDILNSAVEDSLYRYKQCKCLDNNVDCLQELFRQATASTARQLTISAHIIGKFKKFSKLYRKRSENSRERHTGL